MGKLKIPRNLKHANYVDLIQEIQDRSLRTSEKVAGCKKPISKLREDLDLLLKRQKELEIKYCEILSQKLHNTINK